MSATRFVRPETVRLPLSGGDWLIVKRRLTAGEQRAAYARMYVFGDDGTLRVNPLELGLALMTAYLVDWSLVDEQGAVVPIRGLSIAELTTTLHALSPASFTEIRTVIEAHDLAMTAERDDEKKILDGEKTPDATSSSRSAAAGGSTGSVN